MIRINFTSEEIEELRQERFHHPHPMVQMKCEVLLLKSHNLETSKIAKIMNITSNTVRNYFYDYLEKGIEGLKEIKYGGQKSKLLNYRDSIEEDFRNNPPSSVIEAKSRIEELTGIKRCTTQVRNFMHKIGLKFRKSGSIPAKADPEKQEEFKKNFLNQNLKKPEKTSGWYFS